MPDLPQFKYHPDPIATGSIAASDAVCDCCNTARGYIYMRSPYGAVNNDKKICPWCIADGGAAEKFDVTFGDVFINGKVPQDIYYEIQKRTPGFESWQGENWQVHCSDVCEFHGDVSKREMKALDPDGVEQIRSGLHLDETEWKAFVQVYEPGSDPAVYKFICRHCRRNIYYVDFS